MMVFFKKDKKIQELMETNKKLHNLIELDEVRIDRLEKEIISLRKRPPITIDIVKNIDEEDNLPKSYLPVDKEKLKTYLAEIARLNDNKYLNELINYSINFVAATTMQGMYEESRGKYVIEGIRTIKDQIVSGNTAFLKMMEEEKPITKDEQEQLITTSIEEVLNNK